MLKINFVCLNIFLIFVNIVNFGFGPYKKIFDLGLNIFKNIYL